MITPRLFMALAVAGMVSAQSTVTSMFVFDADPQPLVASIMGNDAATTTYVLRCAPGTDSSDCGMGPGLTVVAGPTTSVFMMDEPMENFHWTVSCSVGGTTTAVCAETASGTGANFPGVSATTYSDDLPLLEVTVTGAAASAPASTSAIGTTTTATGTTTGASTTATKLSSTKSPSSASDSSSAVSTGGMPRMTGSAETGMLLGAVAMALGIAAL